MSKEPSAQTIISSARKAMIKEGRPLSLVSEVELDQERGFHTQFNRIRIELIATSTEFRFKTTIYPKDLTLQSSTPTKDQPIPEQRCPRTCSEEQFVETFRKTADGLQAGPTSIEKDEWKDKIILTPDKEDFVRAIFQSIQ